MLELDSSRWAELVHAYGSADDIPDLLRALDDLPGGDGQSEPWHSLWSALAHQGDVYSASFAATPHVVRLLSAGPSSAPVDFFHFPAWIEICRQRNRTEIPFDLKRDYFEALGLLPELVAHASTREWDAEFLCVALAAIAAAKGPADVAEAVLELTPAVSKHFLQWLSER